MKHRNVSLFVPHLGCPHTCIFCNQRTISGAESILSDEKIISSCETAASSVGTYSVEGSEIAFFGGSFTAIDRDLMVHYLETVQPYIGKYFSGIRISTRPDAIDEAVLTLLKKYHVSSIELGAQSMDNHVLEMNERGHTSTDTVNACLLIKEYGFSLGLQMMTGLFGSDKKTDIYTAEQFIKLKPDTVRIYPTVVLDNTCLARKFRCGEYTPPSLEESISLCSHLLEMFNENSIRVIRLGLHSGGNVEDGFIAGVYHPAFGELCMSRIYRNIIERELLQLPVGNYIYEVPSGEISKAVGQHKSNLIFFSEMNYNIKYRENPELAVFSVRRHSEDN